MIDFSGLTNDQLVELARGIGVECRTRGEATFAAYQGALLDEAEKARIANAARERVLSEQRAAEAQRIADDAKIAAEMSLARQQGLATITVVGDIVTVRSPFSQEFVEAARPYGSWKREEKVWVFPVAHEYIVRSLCHRFYGCPAPEVTGLTVRWYGKPRNLTSDLVVCGRMIASESGVVGAGVSIVAGEVYTTGSRRGLTTWFDHGRHNNSVAPVIVEIANVPAETVRKRLALAAQKSYIAVTAGEIPDDLVGDLAAETERGAALQAEWGQAEAQREAEEKQRKEQEAEEKQRKGQQEAEEKQRKEQQEAAAQERLRSLTGGVPVMVKCIAEPGDAAKTRLLLVARTDAPADAELAARHKLTHIVPSFEGVIVQGAVAWEDGLFDSFELQQLSAERREIRRASLIGASRFMRNVDQSFVADTNGNINQWEYHKSLTPEQEAAEAARKAATA